MTTLLGDGGLMVEQVPDLTVLQALRVSTASAALQARQGLPGVASASARWGSRGWWERVWSWRAAGSTMCSSEQMRGWQPGNRAGGEGSACV